MLYYSWISQYFSHINMANLHKASVFKCLFWPCGASVGLVEPKAEPLSERGHTVGSHVSVKSSAALFSL